MPGANVYTCRVQENSVEKVQVQVNNFCSGAEENKRQDCKCSMCLHLGLDGTWKLFFCPKVASSHPNFLAMENYKICVLFLFSKNGKGSDFLASLKCSLQSRRDDWIVLLAFAWLPHYLAPCWCWLRDCKIKIYFYIISQVKYLKRLEQIYSDKIGQWVMTGYVNT